MKQSVSQSVSPSKDNYKTKFTTMGMNIHEQVP